MTLRNLKIFVSVAEARNRHTAAQQLYIAQPAISHAIAQIEEEYHIKLFERFSRKLYITASGNQFLYYAKHILSLFNELEQQMSDTTAYTMIKIGATITIGTCLLHHILQEFKQSYPHADIHVYLNSPDYLGSALVNNELDIALVESLPTNIELVSEDFLDDEMVLVVSPNHPFAQKRCATLEEISKENYIAREPSKTQELFVHFMEVHNHTLHSTWFCNNSETTKMAVMNNYGITVIS